MPRNPKRLRCGTLSILKSLDILGLAEDGCEGRRLVQVSVSGIQGCDAGRPAILHHLQRDGGCSGVTMGRIDGGERG